MNCKGVGLMNDRIFQVDLLYRNFGMNYQRPTDRDASQFPGTLHKGKGKGK